MRFSLRFAWLCVVLWLSFLSGCAASSANKGKLAAPPNVIPVCVRPPNVPKTVQSWTLSAGGKPLVEGWMVETAQRNGLSVYRFDPEAPPESASRLPIPYHQLKCPKRIAPPPPVLPPKPAVVAEKPAEKEKVEADKPRAKAAEPEAKKPPPQVVTNPPEQEHRPQRREPPQERIAADKPVEGGLPRSVLPRVGGTTCKQGSEPGQARRRTGTRICVRTKLVIKRGAEEDPPQTMTAVKLPEPKPLPAEEPAEYADWGLTEPDVSELDPERAKECLGRVCHARHKNFIPKGKKPEEPGYAATRKGKGEGGAPPTGTRTTVKTRKSPLSRPKEPRLKQDGTPRAKPGPRTDDRGPHNAKIIEERNKLEAEGNTVVRGGRKPGLTEERVPITGGKKTIRRPDITYETPDGKKLGRNVGKTNADGTPKTREQDALDDLNNRSDRKTDFVPYDR